MLIGIRIVELFKKKLLFIIYKRKKEPSIS